MTRLRRLLSVAVLAALVVFSCGCAGQQGADTSICIAMANDVTSMNPADVRDLLSETVMRCIFSTLYVFDEQMNLVPCLAESAERLSALEWVFRIREGVAFHDGSALTAEDVCFSVERAMQAKRVDSSLMVIDHLEAVDARTLKVQTKAPYGNLPSLFVRLSTSVLPKAAFDAGTYDFEHPIGSGPFKLSSRKPGKWLELERFDRYFLEKAKSPFLRFVVTASEQARTADLLNGKSDVVFQISSYDCNALKLNEDVTVYESPSAKMELMMFNPDCAPLREIKVREAIAHAVNRQKLVDNVLDGYGTLLDSAIAPPLIGAVDCGGRAYDPALARKLLAECGYPDGFELTALTYDTLRKKMMEYIKLDLGQVGIRLSYEFLPLSDYLDAIQQGAYQCSVLSWVCYGDPDSVFSQLYSKDGMATANQSRYSDARVEALIRAGREARNEQGRRAIYEEANRIVSESYWFLPLYQPEVLVAAATDIAGIRINPQGLFGYESLYRAPSPLSKASRKDAACNCG
ncbi:MAG: ABC transporter substrate-binding protein [Clostridia bacterium]